MNSRTILHVFPSFGTGGVPLRMVRVINHLGSLAQHTIIALDSAFAASQRLTPGLDVTMQTVTLRKGAIVGNLLSIRRVLRRLRPDLLLTYNWGSIEWALANRLMPVCRHIHLEAGFGAEERSAQLQRRVIVRRIALGHCDTVVVPSHTLEGIASERWRIPRHKIRHLPNGVDIKRFVSQRKARDADAPVVIGTVSPLRPEKNIARLISAVGRLPQEPSWQLVIAGDGTERRRLEDLARSQVGPKRITFVGEVSKPEQLLQEIDIFAMSSDTEQMPNALLEAMACGLPVVATDVGDISQMVAPANVPFIVPRDMQEAMTAALSTLISNAAKRASLGLENRVRAETIFSEAAMLAKYEDLMLS